MSKIILLDENTVNKIAAGEVIEKPASIVKELAENAIDAGATSITIQVMEGGKAFISISDNGTGITEEDIPLVFERHATSKISKAEDLFDIHTLGFRGEAMSSIAAISEIELMTKHAADSSGSYVLIKGGKVIERKSMGYPTGTTINVRNLFYNTPARLKFLKSDTTEQGYIVDVLEKLALINTGVSFKLDIDNKTVLHTPGNGDLLSVIHCIYGKKISKSVIPLNYSNDLITIEGYIGKPEIARGNSTFMMFSVNKRMIKNKTLNEAVKQAYKTLLMNNRFPFSVLDVELNCANIDVNVHPTKMEVKFTDERALFNTVYIAVKNCLNTSNLFYGTDETVVQERPQVQETPNHLYNNNAINHTSFKSSTSPFEKNDYRPVHEGYDNKAQSDNYRNRPIEIQNDYQQTRFELGKEDKKEQRIYNAINERAGITVENPVFPTLRILGHLFGTYILCQSKDDFYIIDQHAAHERIMYEYLMDKYQTKDITVQDLIMPIIIELSPKEVNLINSNMQLFMRLGFEIEWYGDNTIAVRSIPIVMGQPCSGEFFSTVLDALANSNKTVDTPLEKIVIGMACKNAIKAGDNISIEEIEELIQRLSKTKMPFTCPHGRPTLIIMSQLEIEKKFKRVL